MSKILLIALITLAICSFVYGQTGTYGSGSGDGSSEIEAILITNVADIIELSQTSDDWNLYFRQTSNIDFDTNDDNLYNSSDDWGTLTGGDWNGDGSVNSSDDEGFTPIGNSTNTFIGTYNGNSYSFNDLYINSSNADNIGLFGYVFNSSIRDCSSSGTITGRGNCGGLVGYCYNSTISSSNSSIQVTGTGNNVGGIVGKNFHSTITNCFAEGDIIGDQEVGGLVGINESSSNESTINKCYSTGNVSGQNNVGGFVGWNYLDPGQGGSSKIINCYSNGNVTRSSGSETYIGGFCGQNYGSHLVNCYSTGSVYGNSWVPTDRGFLGGETGATNYYTNNFFASGAGASNQTSDNSSAATPKTITQMQTVATFTNTYEDSRSDLIQPVWDFVGSPNDDSNDDDVWQIIGSNYPDLQTNSNSALPVELISFSATIVEGVIMLAWETATEINNYGFEIERTIFQAESLILDWQKVGFVDGHGNSNSPKSYEFIDSNPPTGKLEYRLKQIDSDGKYEYYSHTAKVDNKSISAGTYKDNWDASSLSSGVYFLVMDAKSIGNNKEFQSVKKMLLLR